MKYDPVWLQQEAIRLESWNKVCEEHSISPRTIAKYKSLNLIHNVIKTTPMIDFNEIQSLYDSGFSIRKISKLLDIPHSLFSKKIKTRSISDAIKLNPPIITEEGIKSLSDGAKKRGLGGYRPHPNKGQMYKDIWFDSKWEVAVAKSLDENNIKWVRPKVGFVWTDDGKKYYPDFYLPEYDVYLDPKNPYLMIKDKTKIDESQKRNGISVLLLSKEQLNWNTIEDLIKDSK